LPKVNGSWSSEDSVSDFKKQDNGLARRILLGREEQVLNPWSLLIFLTNNKPKIFGFYGGTPSFLIRLIVGR
jgi:hypothetical protein